MGGYYRQWIGTNGTSQPTLLLKSGGDVWMGNDGTFFDSGKNVFHFNYDKGSLNSSINTITNINSLGIWATNLEGMVLLAEIILLI
jgi:hypothetical protein